MSEFPHVSAAPPLVMMVVSSVVKASGVEHWLVPTFALLMSNSWHRSIEPEPFAYQAFTRHITPSMVLPAGMLEKSKL